MSEDDTGVHVECTTFKNNFLKVILAFQSSK